jgi:hypothetical protein
MEKEQTTTTEEVTPSSAAVTSQQEQSAPVKEPPTGGQSAQAATVSDFTPDYTYKFRGEIREIDPMFRSLIKDKESQQKVRDFVERAEAFEFHKTKSKEYESQIQEMEPLVQQLKAYQKAYLEAETPEQHLNLLNEIGYDSEMLKDVVREILRREQMPEEQKRYFEASRRAELEKRQLLEQNNGIRQEFNSLLMNVTQQQMDLEFGKAESRDLIDAYEAANGEGSFRQLFLERGAYLTDRAGRHVAPAEVMAHIRKEFGWALAPRQAAGAANVPIIKPKQKTIPSVGTQNGSPTQPAISSLADLRAKYKQLTGQA